MLLLPIYTGQVLCQGCKAVGAADTLCRRCGCCELCCSCYNDGIAWAPLVDVGGLYLEECLDGRCEDCRFESICMMQFYNEDLQTEWEESVNNFCGACHPEEWQQKFEDGVCWIRVPFPRTIIETWIEEGKYARSGN